MSTIKSDNSDLTINASGTSKDIKFQADGTERMVLKSDGKLGVGTASPSVIIHSISADQGVAHRVAYNTTYYTDYGYYGLNAQSNDFYIKTTGTERLRIDNTSGDVKVNTGNLVIGTAGKGIDFSANTHVSGMSSEVFDSYEEGTFTPVVVAGISVNSGTVSWIGKYTKIGNMVYFRITASGTFNLSFSAGAHIAGLPFALSFENVNTALAHDVSGGEHSFAEVYNDQRVYIISALGSSIVNPRISGSYQT